MNYRAYLMEFWFPSTSVGESAVQAFEARIGRSLPSAYRRFMVEINGGSKPVNEQFQITETGERSLLAELYSLSEDGKGELLAEHHAMKDELPNGCLSIGHDIGGNKICLMISGDESGHILWFDHEVRSLTSPIRREDMKICAETFEGFVGKLH